eukprot:m.227762 g.227762  ORF g.227762 m.227762 type:complete len:500 (-) comp25954_c0_seq1:213-1712(-)
MAGSAKKKGVSFGNVTHVLHPASNMAGEAAAPGEGEGPAESPEPENPFAWKEPSMEDVAQFRDRERARRVEKQQAQNKLKIHQKGIKKPPRLSVDAGTVDNPVAVDIMDLAAQQNKKTQELAIMTRDRHIEKEDLSEYIQKKRDMFLLQYALDVKRDEIKKIEEVVNKETAGIAKAETQLEADAGRFYSFLKENDRTSAAAVKKAEELSKQRVDLTGEVRKLEAEHEALASTVSKNADRLRELNVDREFLFSLAPEDWQAANRASTDTAPCYFESAVQLLTVFSELEAHNLSLITNGQETEEGLQDLEDRIADEISTMASAEQKLNTQINALDHAIQRDEDLAWFARERSSYFNASANSNDLDTEMEMLEQKVAAVYGDCIGENEASIAALQMLTTIENKLEELFERMAKMPDDEVSEAEKEKEKDRRLRVREEKLEAQRIHQEERVRKALERAKAGPKRQMGKQLMFRSAPPKQVKKAERRRQTRTGEEEEMKYYFDE